MCYLLFLIIIKTEIFHKTDNFHLKKRINQMILIPNLKNLKQK